MSAGLDVATHLATTVGSLTLGTNCFNGPVRPYSSDGIPHEAVFCYTTSGLDDEPFIDGGAGGGISFPTVQVRIRSNVDKYADGETLSKTVYDALDKTPPAGYFEARATGSVPRYLGEDDIGHHEWGFALQLRLCV